MIRPIVRRSADKVLPPNASLPPLLAAIYSNRGLNDPQELELSFSALLPPDQLLHVDDAACFLADYLIDDKRLLIVGDFDADGATSCALGVLALRAMGSTKVDYLVPNRFEYGYGLTPEIVALAAQSAPDLIITVDNGISSIEGVIAAQRAGIATLVTDHHLPGEELPDASIIVNPNQPGCHFPSKNLAGVGVIFYVMLALRAELRRRNWFSQCGLDVPNMADYLDLVALGTVADVVPLDHNNRVLVDNGLKRMRSGHLRVGIQALLEVAKRDYRSLVAADLGFAVGPRLNAAGRLDDMSLGIECLLAKNMAKAQPLANQLQQMNQDRRLIEQGMQEDAAAILKTLNLGDNPPLALTLYQDNWHQGVIGILASRIKDQLHRPVIAFAEGEQGQIKGSARSVKGLHIRDILDCVATRNPGLILRFGGHAMAAGLVLERDKYDDFSSAFANEVKRHARDVNLQAVLESDGELASGDISLPMAELLRFAGPWGQHFPEPMFDGIFELVNQRLVGERHLKLVLRHPKDPQIFIDAIAFNIDPKIWPDTSLSQVELAYRLDINEYRGQRSLQLIIEQIAPTSS